MSLVELWVCRLDHPAELAASNLPLLSTDELDRADRFAFDHLRNDYISARGLTRRILASRTGIDPRLICFGYEARGKPFLESYPEWHFNVSHSKTLMVCAVTKAGPIGVDIEHVRDIADASGIAESFFCADEARALALLPPPLRARAFFECWTRKEAFLKATGEGLSRNLSSVAVTFLPGSVPRFQRIEDPEDDPAAWSLRSFIPEENYTAAVAVRAPISDVRVHLSGFQK